jgi:ankyrin repeat protein
MSNKGGNKREKFLESCRKQKLDTVRWSLGVGGQSPSVRDDDGYTAIMIAAAGNLHKVLRMLVDHTRKTREKEQMDLRDGAGDGRTALMMAAAHGHAEDRKSVV